MSVTKSVTESATEPVSLSFSGRMAQARIDREARRAARAERAALARELSVYRTSAERMEIQLLAGRETSPDAQLVLDILDELAVVNDRETLHRSA